MEPGKNSFVLMRKAAKANRLGLIMQEAPVKAQSDQAKRQRQLQQKLHQHYSQELRDRMARMLREQRLRITTLNNCQPKNIQKSQLEHQQRLPSYKDKPHE